jgi:hypothetical protein
MRHGNPQLRNAALLALVLHSIAGIGMALVLGEGLATNSDVQARLNFLVNQKAAWTLVWLTWSAAAISILYFYLVFASVATMPVLRLAVFLAAAGIGPDLAGQAIEIGVLPAVAGRALISSADRDVFFLLDRVAVMLSGYLANGLYSMAAIVLSWFTRQMYPATVWVAGLVVGSAGLILSAAALLDSVPGMFSCLLFSYGWAELHIHNSPHARRFGLSARF